ncbi:hypothetical protein DWF00_18855 [Bosea caraganae]|uniref:DUF308 domain-containing protein n=1 Tax=Bosea caraganae TaxID=2763117 RepID=A0A370L455_9HYPH|nr:hypothetical protein [Bosea caraganae]RDJ23554.1 hypothetical protein DWE98_15445 [Bosea caraganae]RDJ24370.1 hypothetical protein DWF00_18855 [Bosea caraganae]
MIIIFVLFGLAFLVGGGLAIADGWPYLMLERGFTQVIIGSVATTVGIILLALAWVLVELRRVRTALRAMTLLSAVTAVPGEAIVRAADERAPVPAMPESTKSETTKSESVLPELVLPEPIKSEFPKLQFSEPELAIPEPTLPQSRLPGLGTVAAGAGLVAAGGALATVFADRGIGKHEDAEDEETRPAEARLPVVEDHDERGEREPAQPEPVYEDIFDDALIGVAANKDAGEEALAAEPEPVEAEQLLEAEIAPEPELALVEPKSVKSEEVAPDDIIAAVAAVAAGYVPPAGYEVESAGESGPAEEPEPVKEPEPFVMPEPREEPKRSWWPRFGSRAQEPVPAPEPAEADDLSALRQHLTLGPQPPLKPAEPEEPVAEERREESDLSSAEAWMAPAFGRREPVFDEPATHEPSAPEPEYEAEPELPAAADERPEEVEEPHAEATEETAAADEIEPAAAEPPTPEPPRPAASDEGVVGAYQVGDTHFTMYADGSIKARTPDDEYSFASMDELRTYLASEKSKLGV